MWVVPCASHKASGRRCVWRYVLGCKHVSDVLDGHSAILAVGNLRIVECHLHVCIYVLNAAASGSLRSNIRCHMNVTLVKGMPVALTDHIDRSSDKQLLRGKVGQIHSWVLHEQETSVLEDGVRVLRKLPKVVFVKFSNADGSEVDWKLPGLAENGLYPIVSKKGSWYLDRGRQSPRLRITRSQFPLAPAFAMTAHAAQGQTLKSGAIVDLCIGQGTNPLGSYVAMTRVTCRHKLLIYRPFPRELFTQGLREGPDLSLQHLRGEELDWTAIETKYTPSKRCSKCNFVHFKEKYQPMQWARKDKFNVCRECIDLKKQNSTPFRCNNCGLWKGEACFEPHHLHGLSLLTRVCVDCLERRPCGKCGAHKCEDDFKPCQWKRTAWILTPGICKECMTRNREMKVCTGVCGRTLPQASFSKRMWEHPPHKCKECAQQKQTEKECAGPCGQKLPQTAYTHQMWLRSDATRKCISCTPRAVRGFWKCIECKDPKPKNDFSEWLAPRVRKSNNGTARCNECTLKQRAWQRESVAASVTHVSVSSAKETVI